MNGPSSTPSTAGSAPCVLGGQVARRPSDLDTPQPGFWIRKGLLSDDGEDWDNVEGQTVLVLAGSARPSRSTRCSPSTRWTGTPSTSCRRPRRRRPRRWWVAAAGGAWLGADATQAAADDALMLAATTGSESIDGTVFGPRLLGPELAAGLAYVRAVIRTINTHLADGYGDDALAALSEALAVDEEVVADGPAPLFDWEIRGHDHPGAGHAHVTGRRRLRAGHRREPARRPLAGSRRGGGGATSA